MRSTVTSQVVDGLAPWKTPLREWQLEAAVEFPQTDAVDRLWIVTPGGGKTTGAGRVAHGALSNNWAERVIYAVPRTHLRAQVARSLSRNGMHLDPDFSNDAPLIPDGMHGAVVTYAQIASNPAVFADICRRNGTMVILDEVHHASEVATWGAALFDAFENAELRLSMSGTPFRSDEAAIPFIQYERDEAVANYHYDYVRAISDDVCRLLTFGFFDGQAEWISRDGSQRSSASFADRLDARGRSERLRTHLLSDSFKLVIAEAHQRLIEIRNNEHSDAAGLIVCMTQDHARDVAAAVEEITGEAPELVISADQRASKRLLDFKNNSRAWLVAVHMASEGVDIPRLRIGIFGSNVRTEMYIRQFFGRPIRKVEGYDNETALIYLPADSEVRAIASQVHKEARMGVKSRDEKRSSSSGGSTGLSPNFYRPIGSTLHLTQTVAPIDREEAISIVEQREALKAQLSDLVTKIARSAKVEKKKVYQTLWYYFKGPQDKASAENLQQRIDQCNNWLTNGYNGYL